MAVKLSRPDKYAKCTFYCGSVRGIFEFDDDKVDWIDESIFVYEESDDELQTES